MDQTFTFAEVPDHLKQKLIVDAQIHADVLNAGPMAGTGLTPEAATNKGLTKNHWRWRVIIEGDIDGNWQIQFGMEVNPIASVGSMEVQHAGSSHSDLDFASDGQHTSSEYSSNKPPDIDSLDKPVAVSSGGDGGSSGGKGGSSDAGGPAKFSDAESQDTPPSISSSCGGVIHQPTEGAPVLGVFEIKVRRRVSASFRVHAVHTFALADGTTFGHLLQALTNHGMGKFYFRKIGVAYFGCRDFISQAAAAWIEDGLMPSGDCKERPDQHIYGLLRWRYIQPSECNASGCDHTSEEDMHRIPNPIDRAVWPEGYVHHEDDRLKYNQPAADSHT